MKKSFFLKIFFSLILISIIPSAVFVYLLYPSLSPLTYLIIGGMAIFVLLLAFVLSRKIAAPVSNIIKGVQAFKEGDFTTRINIRKSGGAKELAGAFNDMADLTEEALLKQKEVDEIIEKRVKEKTRELDEKIKEAERMLAEAQEKTPEEIEKLLREERERSSEVIKNLTDGLIILDENGKILEINPKTEEVFSIKKKEVEGKKISELKENSPLSGVAKLIYENGAIKEFERKEFSPKEDTVISLTSVRMELTGGKKGYLLVLHDISREKLVQELKTEFVALSAHQLRTPLSGIKWTLKMLIDGDMGELKEGQKEFLQKIYQNNERMIKLINDLLDVTKIEEGKYLYYSRSEDIVAALDTVLPPLKERAKRKGLKFEVIMPKTKPPKLEMDREKIEICMQNLIDNAIKYTEKGEVKVALQYNKKGQKVVFSVKDTGIGIPRSQQKRVFTKFFRATKEHLKSEVEAVGSGLGLYITKNIIKAHGGEIWFESEEGKGSTFYFSLPVKKAKTKEKEKKE